MSHPVLIAIGVIAVLLILAFMWGACIAAGRADDASEEAFGDVPDLSSFNLHGEGK